jgi:hypothetical protein
MALSSTGAISLSQIKTEYGALSSAISLNSFYRGGSIVPNSAFTATVPTSGTISLNNFRGTQRPLWVGMIYPASYNDGLSDAYGFSVAEGVGSASKTGGDPLISLSHFFYYFADGKTYVDISGTKGTIKVYKNVPGTDLFTVTDGGSSSTPPSNWLSLGGVLVSIGV